MKRIEKGGGNINVQQVAVSDRAGSARIHIPVIRGRPRLGLATLRPVSEAQELEVPLDTLDCLLADEPRVDFIKCDVEGHEAHVLAGAEATQRRHRPTLMVEIEQRHLGDEDAEALLRLIESWGYDGEAIFTNGLRPLSEFDLERDQVSFVKLGMDSMPTGYVNTFVFSPAPD